MINLSKAVAAATCLPHHARVAPIAAGAVNHCRQGVITGNPRPRFGRAGFSNHPNRRLSSASWRSFQKEVGCNLSIATDVSIEKCT
jgi:hypothetical protein